MSNLRGAVHTDLSKNSNYAFFFAVDMAKRHNAKIVILHSVEHVRYMYSEGAPDRIGEMLRNAKKEELVELYFLQEM